MFGMELTRQTPQANWPMPGAIVALLKPITWFPPMWAYGCGMIASGADLGSRWAYVAGGILLAGPMICGTSQAVNDWYDRHVDAINEPNRVIPSGRMPGRWGLWVAIAGSLLSLALAALLGIWVIRGGRDRPGLCLDLQHAAA
jgi:chlorophyll synthase